ncbi:MAG: glutaredoxin family protein [Gordonia sp. (in: high G+C Gram-positive bacteria)]|uniref:glutaredoxin family protein n=1 Tax=Gordonia sp. (in: high G+C Gram-positive bacteria) TaxID=84139 RepID=UPI0039E53332
MSVVLYSQPGCGPCQATKRGLDRAGIEYVVVDLSIDETARAAVRALGYSAAPVVVAGAEHWSGFRPERIRALADVGERVSA